MKTGTTYLQSVLTTSTQELSEHGILVPNETWKAGVHDLMGGSTGAPESPTQPPWEALVEEVRGHDGAVAVLSHEFLSFFSRRNAARVAESFSGLEVEVVLTVRDASRTLPAQWHTFARNRGTMTWPEYAASAADPRTRPRENTFLRSQRAGWTLRNWGEAVGRDRLRVVTAPSGAAPDVLWERFAAAAGFDPGWAKTRPQPANQSVGYPTAHLMCLLHRRGLDAGLEWKQVRRLVRQISDDAASRPSAQPRPPLDEATLRFAAGWNADTRKAVLDLEVPVSGDLEDLPVSFPTSAAEPMRPPADDDVLAAAEAAGVTLSAATSVRPNPPWPSVAAALDDLARMMVGAAEATDTSTDAQATEGEHMNGSAP
jgi:hypothetical protein